MDRLSKRLSRMWNEIQRVSSTTHTSAKDKTEVTSDRLVDLAVFATGLGAYQKWLAESESPGGDNHLEKGIRFSRRYATQLEEGMDRYVEPIVGRPDAAALKPLWMQANRSGKITEVFGRRASFLSAFVPWLRRRSPIFNDTFTGKSRRSAIALAQALAEEDPGPQLNRLAAIPSISGLRAPKQWVEAAARLADVSPSDTELTQSHAEEAGAVADKIREVNTALMGVEPTDPRHADLQAEKQDLGDKLDAVVQSSANPSAVGASATADLANAPVAEVLKTIPCNDEQTTALVSHGRVRVSAGAGSGKTRVIIAKIIYEIKEKGYEPHQVWATSFSKKSAAEIQTRLVKYGGEQLASEATRAGRTTHSLAGEILRNFRKDLSGIMYKADDVAKGNLKFIELAMNQVAMTRSGIVKELSPESSSLIKYIDELMRAAPYDQWLARFLPSIKDQIQKGKTLSPKQTAILKRNLDRQGIPYDQGLMKTAAEKGPTSPYWSKPVGDWFNLGEKIEDSNGRPIGRKRFGTLISNFKGDMITPQQAWDKYKDGSEGPTHRLGAAVYGAYEWLMKNDTVYGPAMDYDDWLLKAIEVLKTNHQAKETVQRQAKVVLVDEGQDLNSAQHQFFGIVAEKADTFAYVGDGNQAIYEFRGARPENFIELTEHGFEDIQLRKNFRSGSSIVNAANKLIEHNERRVRMACDPARKDEAVGEIRAVIPENHEEAAAMAAEEISQAIASGTMNAGSFGVAVRNNAETDAFCLALISKGIPFRSKFNFFKRPQIKNMVAWLKIAADKSTESVNQAVLDAYKAPKSNLDKTFEKRLREAARGRDYIDFLSDGGWRSIYIGDKWRNERYVLPYMENLVRIRGIGKGKPGMNSMNEILSLKGSPPRAGVPAKSMMESLVDALSADDLDEIASSSGEVDPSDEAVRDAALSPLRPLQLLIQSKGTIDESLDFVRRLEDANKKVAKKDDPDAEDYKEPAVQLNTVHTWKGLEVDHLYTVMSSGVFPYESKEKPLSPSELESERRLAYVAITRGKDSVTVLCPSTNYRGQPGGPSRFVSEACIPIAGDEDIPPGATENPDNPDDNPRTASLETNRFASIIDEWLDESEND